MGDVGRAFGVRLRRADPEAGQDWSAWRNGTIHPQATFTPNAGKGKYRFRARMRGLAGGEALWSAIIEIRVR